MDIELKSTFWSDFTIADAYGEKGVTDTYNRSKHFISDVSYWKELVLVLNHKIWQHYETNEPLAQVYNRLWAEADQLGRDTFTGDDAKEYYSFLD
jgi:hypothetical protein